MYRRFRPCYVTDGGVGINFAIQDAVAAANILGPTLVRKVPSEKGLAVVQRRRRFPTEATQRLQIAIQNKIILKALHPSTQFNLPWPLKLLRHLTSLRRIPARIVGVGFHPEHITTPAVEA